MKKSTLILGIIILIGCISSKSMSEDAKGDSFSFKELELAPGVSVPPLQYIEADDKIRLVYRSWIAGRSSHFNILPAKCGKVL